MARKRLHRHEKQKIRPLVGFFMPGEIASIGIATGATPRLRAWARSLAGYFTASNKPRAWAWQNGGSYEPW